MTIRPSDHPSLAHPTKHSLRRLRHVSRSVAPPRRHRGVAGGGGCRGKHRSDRWRLWASPTISAIPIGMGDMAAIWRPLTGGCGHGSHGGKDSAQSAGTPGSFSPLDAATFQQRPGKGSVRAPTAPTLHQKASATSVHSPPVAGEWNSYNSTRRHPSLPHS